MDRLTGRTASLLITLWDLLEMKGHIPMVSPPYLVVSDILIAGDRPNASNITSDTTAYD